MTATAPSTITPTSHTLVPTVTHFLLYLSPMAPAMAGNMSQGILKSSIARPVTGKSSANSTGA